MKKPLLVATAAALAALLLGAAGIAQAVEPDPDPTATATAAPDPAPNDAQAPAAPPASLPGGAVAATAKVPVGLANASIHVDDAATLSPTVGGKYLLFAADDGTNGVELWRTDGTAHGTVMLKDINPNETAGSHPGHYSGFTKFGSYVYFSAYDAATDGWQMWRSNGSASGTVQVSHVPNPTGLENWQRPVVAGSYLYFLSENSNGANEELWRIDSHGATVRVHTWPGSSFPSLLAAVGSVVYVAAEDGAHGRELWRSAGTAETTWMVADLNPGSADGVAGGAMAASFHSTLYVAAADNGPGGDEPYVVAGGDHLTMLDNLSPSGSTPQDFAVFGGKLYFTADNGPDIGLYRTDGTESGTVLVKEGVTRGRLTVAGSSLFFVATAGGDAGLWRVHGSSATAVPAASTAAGLSGFAEFTAAGSRLYFLANDSVHHQELWVSDGSTSGTHLVYDLNPTGASIVSGVAKLGTHLVFAASTDALYFQLYAMPY